jgi:hypothetical protein
MYNIPKTFKKFTSLLLSKNDFTVVKTSYGYTAIKNFNFGKKIAIFLAYMYQKSAIIHSQFLLPTKKINF